jgi:hypothetical protein
MFCGGAQSVGKSAGNVFTRRDACSPGQIKSYYYCKATYANM